MFGKGKQIRKVLELEDKIIEQTEWYVYRPRGKAVIAVAHSWTSTYKYFYTWEQFIKWASDQVA